MLLRRGVSRAGSAVSSQAPSEAGSAPAAAPASASAGGAPAAPTPGSGRPPATATASASAPLSAAELGEAREFVDRWMAGDSGADVGEWLSGADVVLEVAGVSEASAASPGSAAPQASAAPPGAAPAEVASDAETLPVTGEEPVDLTADSAPGAALPELASGAAPAPGAEPEAAAAAPAEASAGGVGEGVGEGPMPTVRPAPRAKSRPLSAGQLGQRQAALAASVVGARSRTRSPASLASGAAAGAVLHGTVAQDSARPRLTRGQIRDFRTPPGFPNATQKSPASANDKTNQQNDT